MFCSCTDDSHCLVALHPRSNHYKLHRDRKRKEQERFNSLIMTLFISPAHGCAFREAPRTDRPFASSSKLTSLTVTSTNLLLQIGPWPRGSCCAGAGPRAQDPLPALWGAQPLLGVQGDVGDIGDVTSAPLPAASPPRPRLRQGKAITQAGAGSRGTTLLCSQPLRRGSPSRLFRFFLPFSTLTSAFPAAAATARHGDRLSASVRRASSVTKP